MVTTTEVKIEKDLAKKQIRVTAHFNAQPAVVWQAWTDRNLLDKWWAPKPWRAETEKLEFNEGGSWQYAMIGPKNERQNAQFSYTKIKQLKKFEGIDSFTDDKGSIDQSQPQTYWKCEFTPVRDGTDVKITITPKTEGALEKNLEMGFEQGFKDALGNLGELLETDN